MKALEDVKTRAEGHSPTPWQHQPWGGQNQNGDHSGGDVFDAHGERVVAEVMDADGVLIAAAPKLLAALGALEAVIAEHEARTPFPDADEISKAYSLGKHHGYDRVRHEITEALA